VHIYHLEEDTFSLSLHTVLT